MSETASTIPPSGIGKLRMNDFWKSLLIAAFSNILLSLYSIINTGSWPTNQDLILMVKSTIAIIISYLLKNIGTNNVGELFKKDKPVIPVSAEKLEILQEQVK